MPTLITLSNGRTVFSPKDMEAVLGSIAGARPLLDSSYTVPPGFIIVEDEGRMICVNRDQIASVYEVDARPKDWQPVGW